MSSVLKAVSTSGGSSAHGRSTNGSFRNSKEKKGSPRDPAGRNSRRETKAHSEDGRQKHHAVTKRPRVHNSMLKTVLPAVQALMRLQFSSESKDDLIAEVALLRGAIHGMFAGNRVYSFYLSHVGSFAATSTTGILSINQNITTDIQGCGIWSALATIFDEFTLDVAHYNLVPTGNGFNTANPAPTIFAFDDDALSSTPAAYDTVAAYPSSRLFCPALQGATLSTESNSTGFYPIRMAMIRQTRAPDNGPVTGNSTSSGWIDIGAPNNLLGTFIGFNNGVSITNGAIVYIYQAVFECRFRFVR